MLGIHSTTYLYLQSCFLTWVRQNLSVVIFFCDVLNIILKIYGHLYFSFENCLFNSLAYLLSNFLGGVFKFWSSLQIIDNSLCDGQDFSPILYTVIFVILMVVFFALQWKQPHLSILMFISYAIGVLSESLYLCLDLHTPLSTFGVSDLSLRSLIHYDYDYLSNLFVCLSV